MGSRPQWQIEADKQKAKDQANAAQSMANSAKEDVTNKNKNIANKIDPTISNRFGGAAKDSINKIVNGQTNPSEGVLSDSGKQDAIKDPKGHEIATNIVGGLSGDANALNKGAEAARLEEAAKREQEKLRQEEEAKKSYEANKNKNDGAGKAASNAISSGAGKAGSNANKPAPQPQQPKPEPAPTITPVTPVPDTVNPESNFESALSDIDKGGFDINPGGYLNDGKPVEEEPAGPTNVGSSNSSSPSPSNPAPAPKPEHKVTTRELIDNFNRKYARDLNGSIYDENSGPMQQQTKVEQNLKKSRDSGWYGTGTDISSDPSNQIGMPSVANSVVGTGLDSNGSFDASRSYSDQFNSRGFLDTSDNIGLASKSTTNYAEAPYNQGMEQQTNDVVSDKQMKVFIKHCKSDPIMKNVANLVAKKA